MKRLFYFALSLLLVMGLAACGNTDDGKGTSGDTDFATVPATGAATVPTTEPETDAETETEDPQETGTPATFTAREIKTTQLETFRYWLYTPADPEPGMPLIVYLHGGSGKGDDLNKITDVDGFPKYLRDGTLGDVRAYVIIPQLPSSLRGWSNADASVVSLIRAVQSEFSLDTRNTSLTGHSMGGTGTWALGAAHPELFARIAPLSGSIDCTDRNIAKLKGMPVRAFVGSADTIVDPQSSRDMVDALVKAGENATLTVLDGADHFAVPGLVYPDSDLNLIAWLIGA